MMDCTDRHDRFFLRLMSKNVMLYSEMVATKSAIHGDRKKILSFSPEEKPLALQVGGSNKEELSEVAKIAEDMGYDEININLGCPSKKVQKNKFCKPLLLIQKLKMPQHLMPLMVLQHLRIKRIRRRL